MKKITVFLIIIFLLVNIPAACSQEEVEREKVYVKLTFDSNRDDIGLKNQVKSYVKRGLRQLGDIVFTDEEYKFELSFFVFEPKTVEGERTDMVIVSVIVTRPLPDGRPLYVGDTFKASSRSGLPKLCDMLVTQIDSELIRKERKID
ncbi:MAG: hypothetical protein ACE5JK_08050 [Candidatus Omnitrophota bacterium]